ncbi:MAG: glycerate kinase [Muribaculaceae bacterium]|nr:glycerate kinase [Muribaculaceae bacterium]
MHSEFRKIVVACDSFKGSLSSQEVARAVADGVHHVCPACQVDALLMGDGGEGTVDALVAGSREPMQWVICTVDAPLPELPQVDARYAISADGSTAFMELAQASGMALVPTAKRDIMRSSTLGTGQMMLDALERGCSHIVMGLGGSATCDGGMGVLAALGVEFVDSLGHLLPPAAASLELISEIDYSGLRDDAMRAQVTLLVDVANPLCGPQGAARVFAPQKGASPEQVELIEQAMQHYAHLLGDSTTRPGCGAAGGVGAALTAVLPHCRITPGATFVLNHIGLAERMAGADLVITGEGRIDAQTSMGKAPQAVAQVARLQQVPVVAICGAVKPGVVAEQLGFDRIIAVTPPNQQLEQAMQPHVAHNNVARSIAELLLKHPL